MRKNIRNFEWANDEINVYDIFTALRKYWPRFVFVFVVGLGVSYAYFLKNLPLPHSQVAVEIGFNNVKAGKYPDGSVFSQNDLINDAVIEAVFNNISEVKNANKWTAASIRNALLVEPLYPLEIQMAKSQIASEGAKTAQAETLANYEKIMLFSSSKYVISFSPAPYMPVKLQDRVLSEIVRQYSDYALRQHIPYGVMNGEYVGDDMLAQQNYYPAYEYFARVVMAIDSLATEVHSAENSMARRAEARQETRQDARPDARQETRQDARPEPRMISLNASDAKLKNIRAQLDVVEYAVYDEKSLTDPFFAKKMLEIEIGDVKSALEIKRKQAEYKVYLASLPKVGVPQDRNIATSDRNQSADAGSKSMVDILLTYNYQYYRMIAEADAMNDEVAHLQVRLSKLQDNLNRLNAPYAGKEPLENRMKALAVNLDTTNRLIKELLSEQARDLKNAYSKYQPPILNSFIMRDERTMSMSKVVGSATVCTIIFMVLQIVVYYAQRVAERQRKMGEIIAVESPQANRKS